MVRSHTFEEILAVFNHMKAQELSFNKVRGAASYKTHVSIVAARHNLDISLLSCNLTVLEAVPSVDSVVAALLVMMMFRK